MKISQIVRFTALAAALSLASAASLDAQSGARRPLASSDIDDIARLVMMEDWRRFDSTQLVRLVAAPHPEVRRRAVQTLGRLADMRGLPMVIGKPLDADTAIAATAVWSVGQIRDTSSVGWL